jgi:microsomal epoxide hydrolase
VPTAYARFPKEILRPPRAVAERSYTNITRWTEMRKAATSRRSSSPRPLARDIADFFG